VQQGIRDRLERCTSLPTLPQVAVRVLRLCQAEDLDLGEIASTISHDPALATKTLKLANSPAFGLRQQVRTVSHAVGLLGANAVRTIALSFSLARGLGTGQASGLETYWRRSVLAAVAARELLPSKAPAEREEAFLAGLLQDVGILALQRALAREYEDILRRAGRDHEGLVQLERTELGTDHGEIGGWLLTRWSVPERLCVAVESSHRDVERTAQLPDDVLKVIRAVALSGQVADIWVTDNAAEATARARASSQTLLPGGEPLLEAACARVLAAAPQHADLFDVDLDPEAMAAVLEQAQEALLMATVRAGREITGTREAFRELEVKSQQLQRDAEVDALTGLYNRRRADVFLDDELRAALAQGRPFSVLLADVDHFKQINDGRGHAAGDAVLRSTAAVLRRCVRDRDLVARYGGEEFIVVLPGAPAAVARTVAERIRAHVAAAEHACDDGHTLRITLSVGCATVEPGGSATPRALCQAADRALYAAKRAGRNRVEVWTEALV
jgi:diguanylate cyclase (GGDEF)-like protein